MGGLESHILTLCEHVDRDRINMMIACPPPEKYREVFYRRAADLGVSIHHLPTGERDKLSYLRRSLALLRIFRHERVDIVHIHACGFTGLNVFIAALLARVPGIVVTHHSWFGPQPHNRAGYLSRWFERRMATRAIAVYSRQATELAMAGVPVERIRTVPNAVDLSRFSYTQDAQHVQSGNSHGEDKGRGQGTAWPAPDPTAPTDPQAQVFRLAMVSRLVPNKGHIELIDVVHRLVGRYPYLRLLIVGDGPTRPEIEAHIQALGLEGVVEMTGAVPNDQVPGLLRKSHAIVLPTHVPGETFGIVLIEGMAMGLPAITTRIGGLPDVVAEGETGYVVEPRDTGGLEAAVEKLVSDPTRAAQMGRMGVDRVRQLFSAEAMGRALTTIYLETASETGRWPAHLTGNPNPMLTTGTGSRS